MIELPLLKIFSWANSELIHQLKVYSGSDYPSLNASPHAIHRLITRNIHPLNICHGSALTCTLISI